MPPVKHLGDQNILVPTKSFPSYATFPFENFNPVQSRMFEIYKEDANFIVAASTSSGKTITAEMVAAHEARERGGKVIYLAPLRALAKEKIDDWTHSKHHFKDLGLSICTGDYRLTPDRKKELEDAKIILMTTEMLTARCRNFKSENNKWLEDVGTLISDEFHLLTVPGRGDHAEVGLMKFCQIAKNARIVALSATMPNVAEIADWVSYSLTGKPTYLINSEYRPCPLGIHYEEYDNVWKYHENEERKVGAALEIIQEYPDDVFLVFAHTKNTGAVMLNALKSLGISAEFHSADLDKKKREDIEGRFRTRKLRVLVATSTLAWGCNLPARRVIVLGVHRGLQEVADYDIKQMVGRSGRVGLDPRGDAYVLLPRKTADEQKDRLTSLNDIKSQLLNFVGDENDPHYKVLAFHVVGEIHHGEIKNKEDLHKWFGKSLAYFQTKDLDDDIVEKTLELLIKCGAVKVEDGEYTVTAVGKVASMFYYSPFDAADLRRNFKFLFDNGMEDNDIAVAMALGNVDSNRMGFVSAAETEEMGGFKARVIKLYGPVFMDTAIKGGYAYFTLMNGLDPGAFNALSRTLQFDYPRTAMVLNALDSMSCKWNRRGWFKELELRIAYGVATHLVDLCQLPNVGKARAEKLYAAGFKTGASVALATEAHLIKLLNLKKEKIEEIQKAAKVLGLVS